MEKPRHPKSKHHLASGLFAGLRSFDDFERRVSALPTEKDRGDALEVFAEAYLATQRKHDAAQIWPLPAAPLELLQKLGLATNDYGVDGLLQTTLGQLNVYQVKFRTHRQPLTWRELSTFMGLADSHHIYSRVLFTNCDELPSVMNERRGFFCIRGADLDRLEESDFLEIEKWLAGVVGPVARKSPQPHQQEALDALLPALREHDRATAIMACGTGKTLLSLWIAERMGVSRILVLLPSLALVRQTLHEWLHETRLPPLAYLCVCSDRTVASDLDTISTPQSELDFEVTTDSRTVREFLDAPFAGVKVIFSTYQSVQKAIKPALRKSERFDLGIFDEAHKTAGREGRNFAFALDDKNLAIRKRLFLTATPRHYNPLRKDKEGDAQLVFSMDKPDVYGPQAYRLTFAEAARRGIICHYRVIISVITSGMVTNELLSHGEVLVNGDAIRARQVANQLALKDAIAKYGVNKVFTFHSSVKSAASFTSDGPEGIATHLSPVAADVRRLISKSEIGNRKSEMDQSLVTSSATSEFKTFHVNGAMPTALRERVMRGFRECARGVMSNARCLTEGVDVPAVDMVAFLSPRRSRVDIVQATGRAMRRAPNKTTGYVLVPLYVEQAAGETIEEAVSRAEFDDVWDVLQSLQEQDEVLAEIIREMREERGRTKGFNDARFRERVEILGPRIALNTLRIAITTTCIERLGLSWEERFGELEAFKKRFGHCNVAQDYDANPQLGSWVNAQRNSFRDGTLGTARIQRLKALGFDWDPNETYWLRMFDQLREFKKREGHCDVPAKYRPNQCLAGWVVGLRSSHREGKLPENKVRKLNEIDFAWSPREAQWQQMFDELKVFKECEGHCRVPRSYPKNPQLATWVTSQRGSRHTLSRERIEKLETIGFDWDPSESFWREKLEALRAFKLREGHCNVPEDYDQDRELGVWIHTQRAYSRMSKLSAPRVAKLDELGFDWNPNQTCWQKMFSELKTFKKREGHCNVPARYRSNAQLGAWVYAQRDRRHKGTLPQEQLQKLSAIGFEWDRFENAWQRMFERLQAFQKLKGHCTVPFRQPEHLELASWVAIQRACFRKAKLSKDRVRKLESIGFDWDPLTNRWQQMFEQLNKFKRKKGHCRVSRAHPGLFKIAAWVLHQRRLFARGRLTVERVRKLESIGFEWAPLKARASWGVS